MYIMQPVHGYRTQVCASKVVPTMKSATELAQYVGFYLYCRKKESALQDLFLVPELTVLFVLPGDFMPGEELLS